MVMANPEVKTFFSMQKTIKGHITNSLDGLCTGAISMGLMNYGEKDVIWQGSKLHRCSDFLQHFGMKIEVTPEVFYQFVELLGTLGTCDGVIKQTSRWLNVQKTCRGCGHDLNIAMKFFNVEEKSI